MGIDEVVEVMAQGGGQGESFGSGRSRLSADDNLAPVFGDEDSLPLNLVLANYISAYFKLSGGHVHPAALLDRGRGWNRLRREPEAALAAKLRASGVGVSLRAVHRRRVYIKKGRGAKALGLRGAQNMSGGFTHPA